jgi:hypothetical protein
MVEPEFNWRRLIEDRFTRIPLSEIIDMRLMVNRNYLREKGIDPDKVEVIYDPYQEDVRASPDYNVIIVGDQTLLTAKTHPEDFYILIAHELAHFAQPLVDPSGKIVLDEEFVPFVTAKGRSTRVHVRDRYEQEAIRWEAQQAARLGLSREEYEAYIFRLYYFGREYIEGDPAWKRHVKLEARERLYPALSSLSRRPKGMRLYAEPSALSNRDVRVREHRRRA